MESIEDGTAVLYDPAAPLFPKRMPMGEIAAVAEPAREKTEGSRPRRAHARGDSRRAPAAPEGQRELDFPARPDAGGPLPGTLRAG